MDGLRSVDRGRSGPRRDGIRAGSAFLHITTLPASRGVRRSHVLLRRNRRTTPNPSTTLQCYSVLAVVHMQQATRQNGWFPLLLAVHHRSVSTIQLLLEWGADPDQQVVLNRVRTRYTAVPGDRPLFLAVRKASHESVLCYSGNVRAAMALLEGGASVDHRDCFDRGPYTGSTALIWTARNGRLEMLKFLIASGADTNTPALDGHMFDCGGITALHEAAARGRSEAVQYLLENGADLCRCDDLGRTAVHRAVEKCRYETLRFLCSWRGDDDTPMTSWDINLHDNNGFTPLMIAFWKGDLDIAYFLARKGAYCRSAFFFSSHPTWDGDDPGSVDRTVFTTLLEAINDAGSWNEYVAGLRMPYILIREMVSRKGLVCPSNDVGPPGFAVPNTKQQALYQFVFGAENVVLDDGVLLRAASDDVFTVIASYLGVRLVDDKNA